MKNHTSTTEWGKLGKYTKLLPQTKLRVVRDHYNFKSIFSLRQKSSNCPFFKKKKGSLSKIQAITLRNGKYNSSSLVQNCMSLDYLRMINKSSLNGYLISEMTV